MNSFQFTSRLVTDAVISERSTTTGGHRCLDYIPGACLLGAVADKIYKSLGDEAFTAFHSGKVRFGNGYPLTENNEPSLPVPLAWHKGKTEVMKDSVGGIKNLLHATFAQHEAWEKSADQQKQLRSGYFTLSGAYVQPPKRYRLKTAINRDKMGMAEESQLYGYESLQAGSPWYFVVDFDQDVSEAVRQAVLSALTGTLRIGRSRTAEYGLLEVASSPASAVPIPTVKLGENLLALYCLSDIALTDERGLPTLVPEAKTLGLGGAQFDAGRSFLRVRSYAPFNGTRRYFDLQRQVIGKGSVLVYTGEFSPEEIKAFQERIELSIGLYRQDGLGKVVVNPSFLANFKFTPSEPVIISVVQPSVPDMPKSPLTEWLLSRSAQQEEARKTIEQVERWVSDLVSGTCPKNSQWGQLRNIAFRQTSIEGIRQQVERLCTERVSQKQWSKTFKIGGRTKEYGKFLLEEVLAAGISLETIRQRLYHLGNRIPRRSNEKEQRGEA